MIKLKPNSPDYLGIDDNSWNPDATAHSIAGRGITKALTKAVVAPAATVAPHPELIAEPQHFDQGSVELRILPPHEQ
jgi:hypothetical protein